MSHKQTLRIVNRLGELRATAGIPAHVAQVYDDEVQARAASYAAAAQGVVRAADDLVLKRRAADEAVRGLDADYATAREIVRLVLGDVTVPDTLGATPTLTDTKAAIVTLLAMVTEHSAEPWAASLLASPFGTAAPDAVAKVGEAIEAKAANEAAVKVRNEAFDALYPKLIGFRAVVRRAFGPSSVHYRGLLHHSRAAAAAEAPATPEAPAAGPAATTPPAVSAPAAPAMTSPATPAIVAAPAAT